MLSPTFFQEVEKQHNYVVYSDTDSLYINIPTLKPKNINEAIEISNILSEEINNNIKKYMCEYLLPEMGILPEHNCTFFKTEIVASSLLLLDVKKNYSYKMLAKENNILSTPKVKYVGIPIVRSDYSKFTQDMLKHIIEEIALNEKVIMKIEEVISYVKKMNVKMTEAVDSFDINYIGIPTKWTGRNYARDNAALIGMKLFNTLINKDIFKPLTSGKRIPIKIINTRKFIAKIEPFIGKNKYYLENLEIDKLSNICCYYTFKPNQLKEIFEDNSIEIDQQTIWEILYSTTCRRVVDVIRNNK